MGKPIGKSGNSTLLIHPNVRKIYHIIQKCTGSIGGNGYNGAIYGELTIGSMQKIINTMKDKCEFIADSRFIDVGSGLGKPNFHVAIDPGVSLSVGVELEVIRWQLSMHNLDSVLSYLTADRSSSKKQTIFASPVHFIQSDIDHTHTTDPFTHIYMYDLGFPPDLQQRIAEKFNNSVHAKYLISYRPPHRVIHEYLYSVELICQQNTTMTGSGESHMAYFYKRSNSPAAIEKALSSLTRRLSIPKFLDSHLISSDVAVGASTQNINVVTPSSQSNDKNEIQPLRSVFGVVTPSSSYKVDDIVDLMPSQSSTTSSSGVLNLSSIMEDEIVQSTKKSIHSTNPATDDDSVQEKEDMIMIHCDKVYVNTIQQLLDCYKKVREMEGSGGIRYQWDIHGKGFQRFHQHVQSIRQNYLQTGLTTRSRAKIVNSIEKVSNSVKSSKDHDDEPLKQSSSFSTPSKSNRKKIID